MTTAYTGATSTMLTVLTEPTPFFNAGGPWRNLNRALPGRARAWLTRAWRRPVGGHAAVTRSLLDGLRSLAAPHNYNPPLASRIAAHCVVLSNAEALRQAIQLKRSGRIRRLLAGPNLFTLPTEMDGLLTSPEVDVCLVPSAWVKELYLSMAPALAGRIEVWAAGVDTSVWSAPARPTEDRRQPSVLLYAKSAMSESELAALSAGLSRQGARVTRLDYGRYDAAQFRQALASADLCVFVSASESQGIALQEAWSCNKPTWVFDPRSWTDPHGQHHPASSAPYLTPDCGHTFSDAPALEMLLDNWKNGSLQYRPRAWVEQHMTDTISATRLLHILFNQKGRL
ncbi:hypothetical protein J8I26_09730 [Herbaspirillum sp. LeCh32-8]|uniref:hypothetical protein n=1 Tax=Herbaspirillum sp. LeCh32-8 TaxID=2821356 RepID=UPI001AEAEB9C|nr:hypothetical protein [Herbaspirillum sp. LeCh32-8]MBP0598383.1 hypothetical protein [Herbaspirillum sp. LeCh32-8]